MGQQADRGQGADYPKASDMALSAPLESKLCEMGCGRSFTRPVPVSAREGLKYCPSCLGSTESQRSKRATEYAVREVNARRGVM